MFFSFIFLCTIGLEPSKISCDDYYYGSAAPKNLKTAYECYVKTNDLEMQILMQLNNEGPGRDIKKLKALAQQERESEVQNRPNGTLRHPFIPEKIAEEIQKREQAPPGTHFAYLEYCELADDIGTPGINDCADRGRLRKLGQRKEFYADLKSKLPKPTADLFEKLQQIEKQYSDVDSERVYIESISGTIRGVESIRAKQDLDELFYKNVQKILIEKKLVGLSKADAQTADKQLNLEYQAKIKSYKNDAQFNSPGWAKEVTSKLKESEIIWIKYRDAWVALVQLVFREKLKPDAIENAVTTILNRERAEVLKGPAF
jgi:uncharacterized protein YecT (DUF1311 family)